MGEKTDRDPFANRYQGQETEKTDESEETENTSKTEKTPVKERKNVNMYIDDEELVKQLNARYKNLDSEWFERHGEDLPKNDEFYPSILRAALNGTSIEEELGLE